MACRDTQVDLLRLIAMICSCLLFNLNALRVCYAETEPSESRM